ncbi:uncharacterized protein LOC143074675 isoform X2 [Mytilus galloprovincialis]|uniref:uncharacterized protein LOC143074675 isoform X2 n=1 Tax=Mytilus galloprovincialis TaxID=29158 RepID=UPI003F7C31F2
MMSYLQVFINAIVVALMAMYVYENERKMEKMSTRHDQTALALERKLVDEIKDMKQLLSTKAEKKDFKQIFKACSGNKQSILDTWKKPTMGGDISNIKDSCTNRHLRSTMIDSWNGSLIDQVKVELIRNEQLAVEMFFDGRGSTSSNWFTKNRLRYNSFNDLTRMSSFNFFSMNGDQTVDRHFFINRNYGGCANNRGWMVVIDTADADHRPCKYDKLPGKDYPYILYGPDQQLAVYDQGLYAVANMMVISISTLG